MWPCVSRVFIGFTPQLAKFIALSPQPWRPTTSVVGLPAYDLGTKPTYVLFAVVRVKKPFLSLVTVPHPAGAGPGSSAGFGVAMPGLGVTSGSVGGAGCSAWATVDAGGASPEGASSAESAAQPAIANDVAAIAANAPKATERGRKKVRGRMSGVGLNSTPLVRSTSAPPSPTPASRRVTACHPKE